MKKFKSPMLFASLAVAGLVFTTQAHTVSTYIGSGSDVQMSEQNEPSAARNAADLNTRFNATDRNEVVGLRFDLTGYNFSEMTNVSLNLVNFRDNSTRYIAVYGVAQGTLGGTAIYDTETWSDTNVGLWGDLPGLEESDLDWTTRSVDVLSGNLTLLINQVTVGSTEGTVDSVSSTELTSFVQNFSGSSNITFLITQGNVTTSGGQYRFASKEAASLTSIVGTEGDFAPYLEFDLTTDAPDTNPPSVVAVSPTNGATDVELDTLVEVTFDEAMDATSITSSNFYLLDGINPVSASLTYNPITMTATLIPDSFVIDGSTIYDATVAGGPGGVTDEAGNPLPSSVSWSFTTRALTPDDPVRVVVDADAYLTNGEGGDSPPSTHHGSKPLWEVRWYDDLAGTSRIHIGYIRFDISSVNPEEYGEIRLSGSFASTSYNGPGTWDVWGLNDNVVSNGLGRLGNDWPEGSVCFTNAAGISNAAPLGSWSVVSNETTYLGTITHDGEGIEFNSNPTNLPLASFLAADTDGLVTLILMSDSIDGREYRIDSKEGNSSEGHRPTTLDFYGSAGPVEPPMISGISVGAGPSIMVTWSGSVSRVYSVERATDLVASNWTAVASNVVGSAMNTYTETPPVETEAMYRIKDDGVSP